MRHGFSADRRRIEPHRLRPFCPGRAILRARDAGIFCRARRQRCQLALHRTSRSAPARLKGGRDFLAASREGHDVLAADAGDLELAVNLIVGGDGAIAQRLDPSAQIGIVHGGNGGLLAVEGIISHRPPRAIGAQSGIGDDSMDVKLGIAVARQIMGKQRRDHVPGLHRRLRAGLVIELPGLDQVGLHPTQRRLDAGVEGGDQPFVVADERHQRDRFRR